MLKQIILIALLASLLSGCGKKTFPAGRLQQPAGEFSLITPDGWLRNRLAGIDFIIISTEDDYGIKPNIFVEGIFENSQLSNTVEVVSKKNIDTLRAYEIERNKAFTIQSGLSAVKICARHKTKQNLPLATFQYFIQDAERVISITCTCAEAVKEKYEPIFDAAMTSLQSERSVN